jgi:multidrug resistance efflux pump
LCLDHRNHLASPYIAELLTRLTDPATQVVADPDAGWNRLRDRIKILAGLVPGAPAVKQAEAKLESERDLDQAELNLRYCQIIAEIDGVVTRRKSIPAITSWPAKV